MRDIALPHSVKRLHNSTCSENFGHLSQATELWVEAGLASRSLSPAAPKPASTDHVFQMDRTCWGVNMLGQEIYNVCLINESEGLVLDENPLLPWTCLSRHICIMMTISNYTESFNPEDLKPFLGCKYTCAFCLAS